MKKIIIFISVGLLMLIITLTSMSNMNVINLLVFGSEYSSSGSNLEQYDVEDDNDPNNKEKESQVDSGTMETLQSGLLTGSSGTGGFNLLWLLQNAKEPNKESYAYQLLQSYSNLEAGKYNNYPVHISSEALAASHKKESGLSSFVEPSVSGYGKAGGGLLGKTINGKKITLENAVKKDIIGNVSQSGSVWKDTGAGADGGSPDGCPDGPFQIIQCGAGNNTHADKTRGGAYDLYSFVDAMNVKDSKYNSMASGFTSQNVTASDKAILMLNAIVHNRGSSGAGWMMFGIPFATGDRSLSNYLHRNELNKMNADDLAKSAKFMDDFIKWYDKSNVPLEAIEGDNQKGEAFGLALILANGGFLDIPLMSNSAKNIPKLGDDTIKKLFPGQTSKTIVAYINANYVKKPWDVLGMSKSQYDKIYGLKYANYEVPYASTYNFNRNTAFYIDKDVKSDNYKAGTQTVVRAMEGIAIGYLVDTGLKGTYTLMRIAIEAGITSLTDGTVLDPSNPETFYEKLSTGSYNPAAEATGNYGKFLEGLGLSGKLSETQQAQIKAMYDISGGIYSQTSPPRWSIHTDGKMITDCSSFCSVGLHMGNVPQARQPNPTTAEIRNNGHWQNSKTMTAEVNGKTYPAKTVQLDKSGKPMAASPTTNVSPSVSRKDIDWLPYLQTGDIVNGHNGRTGHVFTYLGKNNTDKNMVLEQHISKVHAQASVYKPGEHFTIQSSYSANNYDGGNGKEFSGKMGLMRLWYDTSGTLYQAYRPVYNLN